MQKQSVLIGAVCLIIGLAIGFFTANSINRNALIQQPITQNQPNAPFINQPVNAQNQPGGMLSDVQGKLEKANNEPENFAAQMNAGDLYAQIGRYDKAFEFYERGVKLDPNNFQANVQLANAYFDSRQFENAEKYYSKALEINPKDVNARTDLGTTFVERQNPDYQRAIKEFQTVLEINPNHEPTLYNLGVAHYRMGDAENAQKILSRLEQVNANSPLAGRLRQVISPK
ncbi:MAG TPA: tetratricopeptide repeat protein [Pyrinomonadaceae bacterium]|jgi:tetratricopeptide (TPR) repeat protein